MRIFAVADIHGKHPFIERIKTTIRQYHPDVLVIAGDITNYFGGQNTLGSFSDIGIPVYGVRGNTDFIKVERQLEQQPHTFLLNKKPLFNGPLAFVGASGTVPLPFLSKICLMEQRRMDAICIPDQVPTVLVAHPPPRGVQDKVGQKFSAGSVVLKNWITKHQPLMVLCGHIHEQPGFAYIKNTLVINCALNKTCGGAIIEYDNKSECAKMNPLTVTMITT